MKKIALITLHTPTATNCRGASALPYHLLSFRSDDVDVEVWSFNINACSREQIEASEAHLAVRINIIDIPRWFRWLKPAAVRLLLSRPMLSYLTLPRMVIESIRQYLSVPQSALWIYGEDIARLAPLFKGVPTVITTPDCEAMYYHRVLGMKGIALSKLALSRYTLMYHRYATMAAQYPVGDNITYHLVGRQDALFLSNINPRVKTVFLPHPHYDVSNVTSPQCGEAEPIKMLVAGRYDFSMAEAADEAIAAMVSLPQEVKRRYRVTFLGKGWSGCCEKLSRGGFEVQQKEFVDDYAAEVTSHHMQLTPVAVGTGTKGKVLDAFANGLMVMGTPLALENIAVIHGEECVEYSTGAELAQWLVKLSESPEVINKIAQAGNRTVLHEHNRQIIAEDFFSLF